MALIHDDAEQELDSPRGIVGVNRGGAGRSLASDGPGFIYQGVLGGPLYAVPGDINVKHPQYGATGNGTTDDTAAINAALAVALSTGRGLYFPAGTYLVFSNTSPIFSVTKPIRIYGDGKISYIKASASTPVTVDVFEYDPASNADTDYITITNLRIGGVSNSARRGIFLDGTGSGEFIRKYLIYRVWLDTLGGDPIYLDSDNSLGSSGIFTGRIDDCWISVIGAGTNSCIKGVNLYDSNAITNCSLTGTGYGVNLAFYSAGGVGRFEMHNNNVTASSGCYFGNGGNKFSITHNYFELSVAYTGSNTALLDIDGASGSGYNNITVRTNLFAVVSPQVADGLRLNYVTGASIDDNDFRTVTGRSGIVLTANATTPHIAATNRFSGAGVAIANSSPSRLGDAIPLTAPNATSAAIANTVSATSFDKTISIPAGVLLPGDWIELSAQGIYSTTGTPTFKLDFLIGGFVFGSNTITTASGASNLVWSGHTKAVVQSIGASGNFRFGGGYFGLTGASSGVLTGQLLTGINTTNAITCAVRITWGAADPANTTVMQSFNACIYRGGMSA